MLFLVNCSEFSPFLTRNRPSSFVRRVCVWGDTVSVTGFSVAQTGFSVAQSVAADCVFRPSPCFCPSICAAAAVHVIGGKTHVFAYVCNNFRRQLYLLYRLYLLSSQIKTRQQQQPRQLYLLYRLSLLSSQIKTREQKQPRQLCLLYRLFRLSSKNNTRQLITTESNKACCQRCSCCRYARHEHCLTGESPEQALIAGIA